MERLYLGYPNDAEVDALLSQLNDENLLKLKVNTHNTAKCGFEYPTFTDGWSTGDDDAAAGVLDSRLASRFSNLKLPITPAKKKGKPLPVVTKGYNSDKVGKKRRDSTRLPKNVIDSEVTGKKGRDSDIMGKKGETGEEPGSANKTSSKSDGSSSNRQQQHRREMSRSLSEKTEFLSCRSSDALAAATNEDDDPENIDAILQERFRALKAPPPSPPPAPTTRNVGLDNLMRLAGNQVSSSNYEAYGSSFSAPSSPHANLLGHSKSRSSPRVMTTSVSSSCHCSAPSPLKLLKQVSSKTFPSKQRLVSGDLPPLSPSPRNAVGGTIVNAPVKKPGKEYKVDRFENSKPGVKEGEKTRKEKEEKKKKKSGRNDENNNPSTVKEMRRLSSAVADRVGLERSRVSSAEDDDFPGEDLQAWSVLAGEQEFARALTEEKKLNREAEQVVEWAKDAVRLETAELDLDSEGEDLEPTEGDEDQDCGDSSSSEGSSHKEKPSKKEKPQKKGTKFAPKKKKWGFF